jgi:NAD(P)-dependent dehydrogenase (short-subunit alcohol dehydrogenase family)
MSRGDETMSTGQAFRMRILLVGAGGTLGRAVAAELGTRHHIIAAGRRSGDIRLDLSDPATLGRALADCAPLDAVVCTAGEVAFAPLSAIHPAPIGESAYTLGLTSKLMGQVNLALAAREHLVDRGSITLTSGILADQPIAAGSSAGMVNAALEGFVRAAAIELPRGIRINLVSPTILVESMAAFGSAFRGFEPVPAARAALAYSRSVEGLQTGQVYRID